jgi:prepilin-type N-terminal cleavage/methylation domain-containing protein
MRKRRAFTLIELLIVVAIIAILAVIIVLNLLSARDKANYARVKDDLNNLSQAARIAYADGTVVSQSNWKAFDPSALPSLKDSMGNNVVTVAPTAPSGFEASASGGYYQYFLRSSTDFGFRAIDKAHADQYCGYINGVLFTGVSQAGATANYTYTKCDGS